MEPGKEYSVSRIIVCALIVAATGIVFVNEDMEMKLFAVCLFTASGLLSSFVCIFVVKRMLKKGDSQKTFLNKLLVYTVFLFLTVIVAVMACMLIYVVYGFLPEPADSSRKLGAALVVVFLCAASVVFVFVPYVQTMIILALKRMFKKRGIT